MKCRDLSSLARNIVPYFDVLLYSILCLNWKIARCRMVGNFANFKLSSFPYRGWVLGFCRGGRGSELYVICINTVTKNTKQTLSWKKNTFVPYYHRTCMWASVSSVIISYLWTYDFCGRLLDAFDAGKSSTMASGWVLGPGNRDFFGPCEMASSTSFREGWF